MAFVRDDLASLGTVVSNDKLITLYVYDSSDDITAAGYFVDAGSTSGEARLHAGDIVYNPTSGQILTVSDAAGGSVTGQGSSVKKLDVNFADGTSENDTGWDLPANAVVREVYLKVDTAEATGGTKTLNIGLLASESGGDANGFCAGLSTSATGIVVPAFTITDGANQNYVSANTYGVFLFGGEIGADAAGQAGVVYRTNHLSDSVTAKSISWTPASNDWAEFDGSIYVVYDVLA
jgi:hypothetical protein